MLTLSSYPLASITGPEWRSLSALAFLSLFREDATQFIANQHLFM